MIIAPEIRQKLPEDSSKLEKLARWFTDFHESEIFVAQAEYQALMDAAGVEDGKPLDNGRARVFNVKPDLVPSSIEFGGQTYVFTAEECPGQEAYEQAIVADDATRHIKEKTRPYFRKDIHEQHVEFKRRIKETAKDFVAKMLQAFVGDDHKGIYLSAVQISEHTIPAYVPEFIFQRKSGHWIYTGDFSTDETHALPSGQIIVNPWAFDELGDVVLSEMGASHKTARFMQWAIGKQSQPSKIKFGEFDIVYHGYDNRTYYYTGKLAVSLAKPGGLLITGSRTIAEDLLHRFKNLKPFFMTEYLEDQFLMKAK